MSNTGSYARKARWMPFVMAPIFLMGAFLIYQRLAYESTDFFTENFRLYPVPASLSEDESIKPTLEALNASDYSIAVEPLLQRFNATKDAQTGIQLSMALMGSKDYWAAITILEEVKGIEPDLTSQSEWYKILCLIALEEKNEAKAMIEYYCEQPDFEFNRERALELKEKY